MNWNDILQIASGILGLFGVSWGFLKAKATTKLLKETSDVVNKLKSIRDKKSDGGKNITAKEAQDLVKEVYEVIDPLSDLLNKYAPKLAKKLGLDK